MKEKIGKWHENTFQKQDLSRFSRVLFLEGMFLVLVIPGVMAQPNLPSRSDEISVDAGIDLAFGDISLSDASGSGTVTVDPSGSRSSTGSVVLMEMGGTYSSGTFSLDILAGHTLNITISPTSLSNGSYSMEMVLTGAQVESTTITASGGVVSGSFVSSTTNPTLYVGATLTVGPMSSNPAGTYNGTIEITVNQE